MQWLVMRAEKVTVLTAFRHPVNAANSLMTQNEEAGSVASSRIIGTG